jgi:membrane protease YdiL (CAAX protease family)
LSRRPVDGPVNGRAGLRRLLALYLASLVGAAVVTPLAYLAVARWAAGGESELAAYLVEKELPRWFDRLRWLFVLAGLPWLCRASGLTGRAALGLRGGREAWRAAGVWLAVGLAMVGAIAVGQLAVGIAGIATLEPEASVATVIAYGLLAGLVSAALIAFFEELVFRGVVFRLCLAALPDRPLVGAVPLAAAIFAVLHFQRVPSDAWPTDAPVTWTSGFRIAWRTVIGMPETVDPAIAAALFLAGAILCLLYLRHGTLLAPMGLHAGWVWAAQLHRRFVDATAVAPGVRFWGGDDLMEGVLPLLLLAGLLAFLGISRTRAGPTDP